MLVIQESPGIGSLGLGWDAGLFLVTGTPVTASFRDSNKRRVSNSIEGSNVNASRTWREAYQAGGYVVLMAINGCRVPPVPVVVYRTKGLASLGLSGRDVVAQRKQEM